MVVPAARGVRIVACLLVLAVTQCARERNVEAPRDTRESEPVVAPQAAPIEAGLASYYARRFRGRKTANGELYDPSQLTAAHRTLPFGTRVEVRRRDGKSIVVRINDRGPYVDGRIIDLSRKAAEELGIVHEGTVEVELFPLPAGTRAD